MKKILVMLLALVMAGALAACSAPAEEESAEPEAPAQEPAAEEPAQDDESTKPSGGKTLILYFSANNYEDAETVSAETPVIDGAGAVEWMANIIADETGGELVPIMPKKEYPTDYNGVLDAAKEETEKEVKPEYKDLGVDPTQYDRVFIGYPMWWYTEPMIIDSLLDDYDFSGVTLIPFNTHEGSGDGGTYDNIRKLEPEAKVAEGLPINGGDCGTDEAKKEIQDWIKGL